MPKIWLAGATVAVVLIVGAAWWQLGGQSAAQPTLAQLPAKTAQSGGGSALSAAPDDHVLGKADAPVTIVEYASLTCPHCASFNREVMPKVKDEWISTGKAKLIYRNFPLNAPALAGAKVAECVKGDRYFAFLDVLFDQMNQWAMSNDPTAGLARLAKLAGVGDEQVKACLADGEAEKRILQKQLIGQNDLGVSSTPTFFINGQKIVGGLPYEQFREALEKAAKS